MNISSQKITKVISLKYEMDNEKIMKQGCNFVEYPRSMIPASGTYQNRQEMACFPPCSRWIRCLSNCIRPEITRDHGSSIPDGFHRTRKRENPESSLCRILSGSKRNPSGKPVGNQRFPSEPGRKSSYRSRMSAKKYRFPRDVDKIIQYILGHGKTNKKSLSKISVRLFLS